MATLDMSIVQFFISIQFSLLNWIMILFTFLGDNGIIWGLFAIALLLYKKYGAALSLIFSLGSTYIIGSMILKHLIERPRPFIVDTTIDLLIKAPTSSSFPSGHASSAVACAIVCAYFFPKFKAWFIGLAFMISISRVYLSVHFLSDIIAGAVLGWVVAYITLYLYKKYGHLLPSSKK